MDYNGAIDYAETNYEPIAGRFLSTKKLYLGKSNPRICRFCGKDKTDVTFRSNAHALPHLIGNNSLFTYYECDECNNSFSKTLEDNLSKYLGISRTISGVKGKKGIPSYKRGNVRIDAEPGKIHVTDFIGSNLISVDEDEHKIEIKAQTEPYIPIAVYKCFLKMALSIMPENEVKNLTPLLSWISEKAHTSRLSHAYIMHAFTPGPNPYKEIFYALLRRLPEVSTNVPYMYFLIAFGNFFFQVPIFHMNDSGNTFTLHALPSCYETLDDYTSYYGKTEYRWINMSESCIRKKVDISVELSYESHEKIDVL
jgi:hypothetical protein